jgi:competence protein ComEA
MQAGMRLVAGLPLVLNEVSAQELALLDGIGPSLSTAIVEYRDRVGRFEHVDELLAVRGIGKKRMNRLRRHLSCAKP